MAEEKRVEFKKLIEQCIAFKEDIDYLEMHDVVLPEDKARMTKEQKELYEQKFQMKTSEDKIQQLLYDEYSLNRHSMLFDQMQDMIIRSRNGNLLGTLLVLKMKKHDFEDMRTIITSCLKNRAGREAIEEIGKHYPRLLKVTEKVAMESGEFKIINQACYIDGINVNKLAHAVIHLNDLEKLQEFGEDHAEDLSIRTRKMMSNHFKNMEASNYHCEEMIKTLNRKK